MIKIPKDLQSLISATYHVNSFKRVVEELVYNSLDAASTSIAIRVNIEENSIQVIDNGFGIKQNNFPLLGQRYTTSKFDNISVVKSIPHTYGFRGLSLANIIKISRNVKIVSRTWDSKDTLSKTFYKGEFKEIVETNNRASKGTTVEIYGLLCNLQIQKKALEQCNELLAIKTSLEQISLIHVNVSFSLRDDVKNEILFKIQKNRDIFQTILSLYDILPEQLQEISVHKHQYRLKAFIEKMDVDLKLYHLVFLNGKYISKTKVQKIINKHFSKYLSRNESKKNKQQYEKGKKVLPTYFLFISCPYSDYDMLNSDSNKTSIEFKNWQQITNLLERFVQCYTGDLKLKKVGYPKKNMPDNNTTNTRTQIKNIIEKILLKNANKQNVQMCNGIKGKQIKRKCLKKHQKNGLSRNISKTNQKVNKLSLLNEDMNCQRKRKIKPTNEANTANKKSKYNTNKLKSERITLNKILQKIKPQTINNVSKTLEGENTSKSHSTTLPNAQQEGKFRREEILEYISSELTTPNPFVQYNRQHDPVQSIKKQAIFKLNPIKEDMFNTSKEIQIDMHPKHLLKEIYGKTMTKKPENTSVMTTYDLVQTVTNNYQNIASFVVSHKNDFVSNFMHLPKNKRYYSDCINKGILCNKLTLESHQYGLYRNNIDSHSRMNPTMRFLSKTSLENLLSRNHNTKKNVESTKKTVNKKSNKSYLINKIKYGMEQSVIIQDDFSSRHRNEKVFGKAYSKSIDVSFNKYNTIFHSMLETDPEYVDKTNEKGINSENTFFDNVNKYRITYSIKSSRIYTELNETKENNKKKFFDEVSTHFGLTYTKDIETFPDVILNKNTDGLRTNASYSEQIDPLQICETTYNKNNYTEEIYAKICHQEPITNASIRNSLKNNETEAANNVTSHYFHSDEINEILQGTFNRSTKQATKAIEKCNPIKYSPGFNIQSRYNFVPKGMSPIFINCNLKPVQTGRCDDDYYKNDIYEKFAEKVMETAHTFEPIIHNVNDALRNDGVKNNKFKKENADLIFDAESIKNAKVLGQVDSKFIVTILPGKIISKNINLNYLALFDQHAVDERIRLEKNLSDYFDGNVWKCVTIDTISFQLPKDATTLLHNHKDKLSIFGLQWCIEKDNISVYTIPEAILGKNPRQADVVLKATKCLLSELIEALKNLKGNIPLYPQSIMNLIFSEACRYAIMFGDKLSNLECINLINSLSECKTPFQCAHGRPVMAVIMELSKETQRYKVNDGKILDFRNKYKI